MKKLTKNYEEYLLTSLRDPREAAAYLDAALAEGNYEDLLMALRDLAKVYGGMSELAKQTNLSRPSLYRMLSESGNPEIASLGALLKAMNLRLAVKPLPKTRPPRRHSTRTAGTGTH